MEEDFDTFDDFLIKYPLDEITLPVAIQMPDEEGEYWLIQVAFPMRNKVVNCCIWKANQQHVTKYKMKALVLYKQAMGIAFSQEKKYDRFND